MLLYQWWWWWWSERRAISSFDFPFFKDFTLANFIFYLKFIFKFHCFFFLLRPFNCRAIFKQLKIDKKKIWLIYTIFFCFFAKWKSLKINKRSKTQFCIYFFFFFGFNEITFNDYCFSFFKIIMGHIFVVVVVVLLVFINQIIWKILKEIIFLNLYFFFLMFLLE